MKDSLSPIPRATYRLQLGDALRFADVTQLAGYLSELGIAAAYLSPFFHARRGSTHGYDSVNHQRLEPRLGDESDFQALAETLRNHEMGLIVDMVPNHMGIDDPHNAWWQDVLENGPASLYARYFDIDWNSPKEGLRNKVLLPVLGDQFGKILEGRELQLEYGDGRFVIAYYDRRLPIDPRTWTGILKLALEFTSEKLGPEVAERMELESIITALEHLPSRNQTDAEPVAQRYRESEVARRRLMLLVDESAEVRHGIERAMEEYNGRRGDVASFDQLEALLVDQAYRLCHWRVATDEINYRRFFDVDFLAAIRVEEREVFDAVHEMVLRFVERGWVTGLRIDHADGLADPRQYLADLAESVDKALGETPAAGAVRPRLYTLVEKILAHDETLPSDWSIHGTTGYEFLNWLNGVFIDRLGMYSLTNIYGKFTGRVQPFPEVLYESKRDILSASLSSEIYTLSHQLDRISEQHRWSRDFTRLSLFRALRELVACFPVYRTYIRPKTGEVLEDDRRRIMTAVRVAKRRNPAMSPSFFDFIAEVLLLQDPDGLSEEARQQRQQFVVKFQQVTGPVTAKGLEDTSFYRYYPLASLNEVGSDPSYLGMSVEQFHRRVSDQRAAWPHTMLTTGTHDTKRGEDFRARLNVLSEIPDEWEAAIVRWHELTAESRQELDGAAVPDANEEYLIYQTLVGAWPLAPLDEAGRTTFVERIVQYLDKALKEAKLHTSWLNPYSEYDQAVAEFIRKALGELKTPFAQDVDKFVRRIADAGFVNSLAQTLVKIAAPGVPDFYQGVEFWDFHLVDPDNRHPVDFAARQRVLKSLVERSKDLPALSAALLKDWPDDALKMFVIHRALQQRAASAVLVEGDYQPLTVEGPRKANVCAFLRVLGNQWAVCVVPRMTFEALQKSTAAATADKPWPAADYWCETTVQLPAGAPARFRHALSGSVLKTGVSEGLPTLDVGAVFESFPVALLVGEPN